MADSYQVSVRITGQNQLSAPVGQATQSLRGLGQEAQRTNTVLGSLKSAATGVFTGIAVAGAVRFAEELYQSGVAAQRAEALFRSFSGQLGDVGRVMDELRRVTRGVVDDTALMEGSSRLLSMGIAKNSDELIQLTDIAASFAQAMGTDVAGSLEQIALIVSNSSYLRLDSLGIGSAQVRELVNGYTAAGMDSSEAFTKAFIEVASEKLPQMQAIADVAVTPFQQLQTSMTNFMDDFGNNFAYLLNEMARGVRGLAEAIDGIFGNGAGGGQDALNATAAAGVYADLFAGSGMSAGSLSGSNISGAIAAAIMAGQRGMDTGSAGFMDLLTQQAFGLGADDIIFQGEQGQMMLQQAASVVGWYQSYIEQAASAQSALRVSGLTATGAPATQFAAGDNGNVAMGGLFARFILDAERQAQVFQTLMGRGTTLAGGLQIMRPEDAQAAENAAYALEQMVGRLERAGLEESFLAPLRAAATASREGADAAAEWATNLANASLPELFGQTDGGRKAEIDNALLSFLGATGASQDQIDAYAQVLGMDSGAITGMSAQFENTFLPMLAEVGADLGPQAVIALRDAYLASVEQYGQTGYSGTLPLDLIAQSAGLTLNGGSIGGGSMHTVAGGDTLWGIATANGMTVDQLRGLNPGLNGNLIRPGQSLAIAGAGGGNWAWDPSMISNAADVEAETDRQAQNTADSYQYNLENAFESAVDVLSSSLESVAATTVRIPIEFVVTNMGAFGEMIAGLVAGNGGTTPGTSPYNGRSTPRQSGSAGRAVAIP